MVGLDERAIKNSPAWEHMKNVVRHLAAEQPKGATDIVESVSSLVASGSIVPEQVHTVYHDGKPKGSRILKAGDQRQNTEWAIRAGHQLVPPKPVRKVQDEEEDEPAEEEEQEDKGELPDVVEEQEALRRFGAGVPEDEAFRIVVSLKRLLDKEPLAKARFWGKIKGLKRDYVIAECKIDESRVPDRDEVDEDDEEADGKPAETIFEGLAGYKTRPKPKVLAEEAKGANDNVYYVATSEDLSEWVRLPDVLPAHVTGARAIYKLFTGDLDAPVEAHPPFPGVERHYLRAQIARISSTCAVAPKDMYTTEGAVEEDEEDDNGNIIPKPFEVAPYEEIPPLNPQEAPDAEDAEAIAPIKGWFHGYKNDELLDIHNWVHIAPSLLADGRATKFVSEEEPPQDNDEEEDDTEPEEGIPGRERINPFLSDLSHDHTLSCTGHTKADLPAWATRRAFDTTSSTTRAYLIRSLLWDGAVCCAVTEADTPGAQVISYYCGNGVKSITSGSYAPALPPLRSAEFPVVGLQLMKDCTYDDEIEFEPTPPIPVVKQEEEEEEDE